MKLTRLRLLGFKSFVEPTDVPIEPGLTGIVGPNGCGKSNLVEALRWVMGEASHKAMRAADMDDVIFSGSNTRPARNMAEVVARHRQQRAPGSCRLQRLRPPRRIAPDRARARLHLSHQRPRGAGARRADPVRRRLDRRALAGPGASGPHRRDHPGEAGGAPARAGGSRRRRRAARAAARSGAQAEGRGAQSRAARGRHRPAGAADRGAQAPGPPGGALQERLRPGPPGGSDAVPPALPRSRAGSRRRRASQGCRHPPGGRTHRRPGPRGNAAGECRRRHAGAARRRGQGGRRAAPPRGRARDARQGRGARQGAHRRARPAARPARRRRRTREAAHRGGCGRPRSPRDGGAGAGSRGERQRRTRGGRGRAGHRRPKRSSRRRRRSSRN